MPTRLHDPEPRPERRERPAALRRSNGAAPPHEPDDGRVPALTIQPENYPAAALRVRDLIAAEPRAFERGGRPVLITPDGNGDLAAIEITAEMVANLVHRSVQPTMVLKLRGAKTYKPVTLPHRVAQLYLALHGEWNLRPLAGIATTPGLRDDGTIITADGYDAAAGIYRFNVPRVAVPDRPTRADAEAALRRLRAFLRTFCFRDAHCDGDGFVSLAMPPGHDESAALVALLTAVCRPCLPLAPGFIVKGPNITGSGAGKGKLVRAITNIASGRAPALGTLGHSPEETDKRLVGLLLAAHQAVLLDNVNATTLQSDTLASALTEQPCLVRPLGQSAMVKVEARTFLTVTGNGITLGEDLIRRFVVCDFDPRVEDPETRVFETDAETEALRRRAELLGAVLTIWRWGRQEGDALPQGRPLGSFTAWCRWCRDPLVALGCRDPAERLAVLKAEDPHRRAIAEAFAAWSAAHADRPVAVADLAEPVREALDPQGRGRQFLAAKVQRLVGTRLGGFCLEAERGGSPAKPVTLYRLRKELPCLP